MVRRGTGLSQGSLVNTHTLVSPVRNCWNIMVCLEPCCDLWETETTDFYHRTEKTNNDSVELQRLDGEDKQLNRRGQWLIGFFYDNGLNFVKEFFVSCQISTGEKWQTGFTRRFLGLRPQWSSADRHLYPWARHVFLVTIKTSPSITLWLSRHNQPSPESSSPALCCPTPPRVKSNLHFPGSGSRHNNQSLISSGVGEESREKWPWWRVSFPSVASVCFFIFFFYLLMKSV